MSAIEIAAALAASRRAVRLYPPEHPTHREALRDLVSAVTSSIDVRPLVLNTREGRLYEGSEVITETSPATRSLAEAMEVRRVESLTFHVGFSEVDGEALSEVLSLRPDPDTQIQEELDSRGARAVTVSELEDNLSREAEERDRRREADRAVYRTALTALTGVVAALETDQCVKPHETARVVAAFIERVAEEPAAIIALATMTGHGDLWRFRAVGVMLYSLVLGRSLGLSDKELLSLGMASLLRDVGGVLSDDGEPATDDHAVIGARALGAFADDESLAAIVALEHHMGIDGSGTEGIAADYHMHPYSRIVAVADRYDRLIRPDSGEPLRPDLAASHILREGSEGPLDPTFSRLFVLAIGILPVGSFVRLSDHSIGVVKEVGEEPLRPQLRVILAPDGTPLRPSVDTDLAEDQRTITEVIAGGLMGMQTSDYL